MPELPEVETTRRGLMRALNGETIARVALNRPDLRFPFPPRLAARLKGRTITAVRRRAKYLLIDLDDGQVMLAHLGMSGSFTVLPVTEYVPRTHDHLLVFFENGLLARFHDPRRFGIIDMFSKTAEKTHKLLAHLGPEPLSEAFSVEYLKTALAKRSGPIKPALMDAALVVGVGNIYASESLHRAGIHPAEKSSNTAGKLALLVPAIRNTLEEAIASGGSTLRDFVGAQNEGGYFQHRFLVYERAGQPCFGCGKPIQSIIQSGRSSYFCANCQKPSRSMKKPRKTAGSEAP